MNAMLMSLNSLKSVDIIFFVCCIAAVALAVIIYFLIPVFNKKQYQEQRDNLRKREEAFKANKKGVALQDDTQVDIADAVAQEGERQLETSAEAQENIENTDGNN